MATNVNMNVMPRKQEDDSKKWLQLSEEEKVEMIDEILKTGEKLNNTDIADLICTKFKISNPDDVKKTIGKTLSQKRYGKERNGRVILYFKADENNPNSTSGYHGNADFMDTEHSSMMDDNKSSNKKRVREDISASPSSSSSSSSHMSAHLTKKLKKDNGSPHGSKGMDMDGTNGSFKSSDSDKVTVLAEGSEDGVDPDKKPCSCGKTWEEKQVAMIRCDQCKVWYHQMCVGGKFSCDSNQLFSLKFR
jgi:hypothetical protein